MPKNWESLSTEDLKREALRVYGWVLGNVEHLSRDELIEKLKRMESFDEDQSKMKGFMDYRKGGEK